MFLDLRLLDLKFLDLRYKLFDVLILCLIFKLFTRFTLFFYLLSHALQAAASTYNEMTQQNVKIELDTKNFLREDKIGGIVLITKRGRLTIDNTLVARLQLISHQLLPEIRGTLFGENPNRKFKD